MNNKKTIWFIIMVLVFGGISFYTSHKADNVDFTEERQDAIEKAIQRPTITINTKHQYKDGEHIFLGSFEVPSPCYSHNAEVIKEDESGITEVALSYNLKESDEICAQVIDEREFKVVFEGDLDDDIIATLNGEVVNFNVFEISPDEDISEVEIFIKG